MSWLDIRTTGTIWEHANSAVMYSIYFIYNTNRGSPFFRIWTLNIILVQLIDIHLKELRVYAFRCRSSDLLLQ